MDVCSFYLIDGSWSLNEFGLLVNTLQVPNALGKRTKVMSTTTRRKPTYLPAAQLKIVTVGEARKLIIALHRAVQSLQRRK